MSKDLAALNKHGRAQLDLAKAHAAAGLHASASVVLTLEMIKTAQTLEMHQGSKDDDDYVMAKTMFDTMKSQEEQMQKETNLRMQVFGMLYKEGARRKALQLRLWVMDGAKVSYYKLGDSKPKGSFHVHMVKDCQKVDIMKEGGSSTLLMTSTTDEAVKKYSLKVELYGGRSYIICAPDENSQHVWEEAFHHTIEDHMICKGSQGWERRWLVVYKSVVAIFESAGGACIGCVLMKEILPGSVKLTDEPGKDFCWSVETPDEVLTFQAAAAEDAQAWIAAINGVLETRGNEAEVNNFIQGLKEDPQRSAAPATGENFGRYSVRLSACSPTAQAMRAANYNKDHPLARAIGGAHECVKQAQQLHLDGHLAHASVKLSLEMLKIANAIREYCGEESDEEANILRAVYDEAKELEAMYKAQAVREMIVYGMVYKRGHKRKNWQMRLFVLDGASCKYFELGNTAAPKGSIELAQIAKTEKDVDLASKGKLKKLAGADEQAMADHKPWKKHAMRLTMVEKGLQYIVCPPDVNSMNVWPSVAGDIKVYLDRGSLSTWVSKYGILHKTQLAWFDNATSLSKPGGSCLLKQASSVSLVPEDKFHQRNVFELVCAGTAYYFQASNTAEWVYYILDMLNKRAGEEAEANKAQMALSTSGVIEEEDEEETEATDDGGEDASDLEKFDQLGSASHGLGVVESTAAAEEGVPPSEVEPEPEA